jgi:hypothetical protein
LLGCQTLFGQSWSQGETCLLGVTGNSFLHRVRELVEEAAFRP